MSTLEEKYESGEFYNCNLEVREDMIVHLVHEDTDEMGLLVDSAPSHPNPDDLQGIAMVSLNLEDVRELIEELEYVAWRLEQVGK